MVRSGDNPRICFTLRQWSLILAIVAFVVTALLTFGAILGLKHTRYAWEFVLSDLAEEDYDESNSLYLDDARQIRANKKLLHESQHIVQGGFNLKEVLIFLLDIGTIFGCLNQIACGLMLYGITVRSTRCILPWIIISGITYVLVVTIVFISYLELVPGVYISSNQLIAGLSVSSVFILIWYTMLLYYYYLLRPSTCAGGLKTVTPKIIRAYGGYLHKINMTPDEKKAVV